MFVPFDPTQVVYRAVSRANVDFGSEMNAIFALKSRISFNGLGHSAPLIFLPVLADHHEIMQSV